MVQKKTSYDKRAVTIREDEIEKLRESWPMIPLNIPLYTKRWDELGDMIETMDIPLDTRYLELIDKIGKPTKEDTVLEIGCGSGDHCFALADKCKKVIGLDISPTMIRNCKNKAEKKGIENVEFHLANWFEIEDDDPLIADGADIVLAHYSPAIDSFDTFMKMVKKTKKAGFVCLELNWNNDMLREIHRITGIGMNGSCEFPINITDTLWHLGYSPRFEYRASGQTQNVPVQEAFNIMYDRLKMFSEYDPSMDGTMMELAKSLEKDGLVPITDTWTDLYISWSN